MKHRTMLQMSILVALGLGVLFSLVAFDQPGRQDTELLEVSVIIREADSTGWSAARQGMEQAAADLGAEPPGGQSPAAPTPDWFHSDPSSNPDGRFPPR